METQVKVIEHIRRASSSVNGNPAYVLTFTDGTEARTMSDAACAYAIGNPDMREGCSVVVQFTRAGRIRHMGPYARTADEIQAAASQIADEIAQMARNSGDCPIVWVTGNHYMPPLRSFEAAEAIWQADETGEDFAGLVESVERALDKADVLLDCPDYDNALYAVDLRRFEYVESDGDNLADDWRPIG